MPAGYSLPEYEENVSYESYHEAFEWDLPEEYNIASACLSSGEQPRSSTALHHVSESDTPHEFSFAALDRASDRFARTLGAWDIDMGNHVAVCFPQSPELLIAHLATYKRGAVTVPLSVLLGAESMHYALSHSEAEVLIIDRNVYEGFESASDVFDTVDTVVPISLDESKYTDADDHLGGLNAVAVEDGEFTSISTTRESPALILYTSGTSGRSKGVVHAHRYLIGSLPGYHLWFHLFDPNTFTAQRVWTPSEWAWAGALFDVVFPTLAIGGTVVSRVRRSGFDPETALSLIDDHCVTRAFVPPTALTLLRDEVPHPSTNLPSLEVLQSGGEPLNPAVQDWAEAHLDVVINEGYGQTEANAVVGNCRVLFDRQAGSMGRPYPGHSIRVLDENESEVEPGELGELAITAPDPVFFLEYWNQPAATAEKFTEDGSLKTGDMVVVDEDGYVWFRCRKDELIVASGYRISPVEVEDALKSHPLVVEAVVGGIEDRQGQTLLDAHVLPVAGKDISESETEELKELVRDRLGAHKVPDTVTVLDDLPQTSSGKVDRSALFD